MKIVVNDVEYPLTESIQGATLLDLMKLKVKTRGEKYVGDAAFKGVDPKGIMRMFRVMRERVEAAEVVAREREEAGLPEDPDAFDQGDLLGDPEFLVHIASLIWLARRKAGDEIEFDEAASVGFDRFNLLTDEDDEEDDDADPKVPLSGQVESSEPQ